MPYVKALCQSLVPKAIFQNCTSLVAAVLVVVCESLGQSLRSMVIAVMVVIVCQSFVSKPMPAVVAVMVVVMVAEGEGEWGLVRRKAVTAVSVAALFCTDNDTRAAELWQHELWPQNSELWQGEELCRARS